MTTSAELPAVAGGAFDFGLMTTSAELPAVAGGAFDFGLPVAGLAIGTGLQAKNHHPLPQGVLRATLGFGSNEHCVQAFRIDRSIPVTKLVVSTS